MFKKTIRNSSAELFRISFAEAPWECTQNLIIDEEAKPAAGYNYYKTGDRHTAVHGFSHE